MIKQRTREVLEEWEDEIARARERERKEQFSRKFNHEWSEGVRKELMTPCIKKYWWWEKDWYPKVHVGCTFYGLCIHEVKRPEKECREEYLTTTMRSA